MNTNYSFTSTRRSYYERFFTYIFLIFQNKVKNFKNVYIHLDLDILDKAEFEFSLFPTTSKGLLPDDVARLISELKMNNNVVGFCISECTATKIEQLDRIKSILDQIEL